MPSLTRRELLEALGLSTAATAVGCTGGGEPLPWQGERTPDPDGDWSGKETADTATFPLGVQSGDPHPDGLVLWTRYDGEADLEVVVATWEDGAWVEQEARGVAVADGGFVHHLLDDLPADQPLAFQFRDAEGVHSPVGHGRTAFAPDQAGILRLGATSCASQGHGDFPSMAAAMARGPLDAWLWLGDTVYCDKDETLEEYRGTWGGNLGKEGFQSVLGGVPGIYSWDDHEVANNWDVDEVPSPERLETAYQAYFEHTTIRRHPDDDRRIWRSFRYGRTAELFVLDCRGERDPEAGRYISPEQLQWLKDGLSASTATWKVLVNSVPLANMPELLDLPDLFQDRWEGYPEQRRELLDHIHAEGIGGVLVVSGDMHYTCLCRLSPEPSDPEWDVFETLVGPAGSRRMPFGPLLMDGEQFPWSDAQWSCTRLELHPHGYARIVVVGEEDQTWFDGLIDDRGNLLEMGFMAGE